MSNRNRLIHSVFGESLLCFLTFDHLVGNVVLILLVAVNFPVAAATTNSAAPPFDLVVCCSNPGPTVFTVVLSSVESVFATFSHATEPKALADTEWPGTPFVDFFGLGESQVVAIAAHDLELAVLCGGKPKQTATTTSARDFVFDVRFDILDRWFIDCSLLCEVSIDLNRIVFYHNVINNY